LLFDLFKECLAYDYCILQKANSTVAKGMIGDITSTTEERAWGYAMYGAVFGVSGVIGPAFAFKYY
jgi:hypothetical protein